MKTRIRFNKGLNLIENMSSSMNKFYWCYITNIPSSYYGYGYWCKIMADTPKQAYKTCKTLGYKISKIKKAYGFWNRLNKDNSIKD